MYQKLFDEDLVVLITDFKNAENEIDDYCELMKEMFLSTSGIN